MLIFKRNTGRINQKANKNDDPKRQRKQEIRDMDRRKTSLNIICHLVDFEIM